MKDNADFKIVVAYENFSAAIQAREMSNRLAVELELDCTIDCDFWKFDLLNHPQFRGQAAAEAAEAGMIILASETSDLPEHVKNWIEGWPPPVTKHFVALVALFDEPGKVVGIAPPVCEYLRRVAGKRSMDFFCKAGDWWQFDLESLKENRRRQLEHFVPVEEFNPRHFIGTGWGIND